MKRVVGMLLVLVVGCRAKEGAVATLEELGGRIYRDEQGDVTTVNLSRSITNDAEMRHLQKLTALLTLSLNGTQITDAGLSRSMS